jgi:hypothetical protein
LPRRDQAEARDRHNSVKAPPEAGIMSAAGLESHRRFRPTVGAVPRSARSPGAGSVSSRFTPPEQPAADLLRRRHPANRDRPHEQPDRRDIFPCEPIRADRDGWSSLPSDGDSASALTTTASRSRFPTDRADRLQPGRDPWVSALGRSGAAVAICRAPPAR